ncbi:MAG: Rid family detoxifying hydrolase [Candidatus Eremiobacteraeota bacterium]|nr:Rid family detoxifying hydrolase [Candidatus Eremiobacteraeota bacterium]
MAFADDEQLLLWSKLVFYAPFALLNTATCLTAGQLRDYDDLRHTFNTIAQEIACVAAAEGVEVSASNALDMLKSVHATMESSMRRDWEKGLVPEIDAVGYAVVRRALQHRVLTPHLLSAVQEISRQCRRSPVFAFDAPAPVGPYSQAIRIDEQIFVSGQLPIDADTGLLIDGSFSEQLERTIKNVGAVLAAADCTYDQVTRITIFLADMRYFEEANRIYSRYFTGARPSGTTIAVSGLPRGALVEIDAIATRLNSV